MLARRGVFSIGAARQANACQNEQHVHRLALGTYLLARESCLLRQAIGVWSKARSLEDWASHGLESRRWRAQRRIGAGSSAHETCGGRPSKPLDREMSVLARAASPSW